MLREDTFEIIIFCSLMVALGVAWYVGWVIPRTEFLHAIMDCMVEIGDSSEIGYNICVERVSG